MNDEIQPPGNPGTRTGMLIWVGCFQLGMVFAALWFIADGYPAVAVGTSVFAVAGGLSMLANRPDQEIGTPEA